MDKKIQMWCSYLGFLSFFICPRFSSILYARFLDFALKNLTALLIAIVFDLSGGLVLLLSHFYSFM